MKTSNSKKRFVISLVVTVVSIAMLVGATFAWFTDSVTSGKNKIVAGNLDVELEYSTDMEKWNSVDAETNLFENCLWEPGYTQVVYFKVKNAGTLALQYKLGINVASEKKGKNVAGEEFSLSDYIKFGTKTDVTEAYATRDAARADVSANAKPIKEGYTFSGNMEKGADDKVVAVVLYMPEEVGNEANYRTTQPEITLGINLSATQWTKEKDSFDDQYDKDAEYPDTPQPQKEPVEYDDENNIAIINGIDGYIKYIEDGKDGYAVVLGGDIDFGGATIEPMVVPSLDGKGYSIKNVVLEKGGLFEEYNESLFVQNVTLENITVRAETGNAYGAGVVAARIRNGKNGVVVKDITIKNCSIDSTRATNSYAGALCGTLQAINVENITVENCIVKGKNAGGLVGFASADGADTEIKNCSVTEGSVTTTATNRHTTGTIVGRFTNPEGAGKVTGCSATGVTIVNTFDSEVRLVGDTGGTDYYITVDGEVFSK